MEQATSLGVVGALLGSAAYFTNLTVSGITLAFPKRPSWLAFVSALLLGMFYAALLSVANGMLLSGPISGQAIAQVLLVGIAAGGGAAGATVTQTSANSRRQDALDHAALPAVPGASSVAANG